MAEPAVCVHCGIWFTPKRITGEYHDACRKAAHAEKKRREREEEEWEQRKAENEAAILLARRRRDRFCRCRPSTRLLKTDKDFDYGAPIPGHDDDGGPRCYKCGARMRGRRDTSFRGLASHRTARPRATRYETNHTTEILAYRESPSEPAGTVSVLPASYFAGKAAA